MATVSEILANRHSLKLLFFQQSLRQRLEIVSKDQILNHEGPLEAGFLNFTLGNPMEYYMISPKKPISLKIFLNVDFW